jgi:hypothetical protein
MTYIGILLVKDRIFFGRKPMGKKLLGRRILFSENISFAIVIELMIGLVSIYLKMLSIMVKSIVRKICYLELSSLNFSIKNLLGSY